MSILTVLISILVLPLSAYALDFSVKSEKAVVGQDLELGMSFSSVLEESGDVVVVNIRWGKKQVIARINYKEETVHVTSVSLESGESVKITSEDLATLKLLSQRSSILYTPGVRVNDTLVRLLGLLAVHPPNEVVDVFVERRGKTDTQQTDEGSLCNNIGATMTGNYDIGNQNFVGVEEIVGPCDLDDTNECLGRCGEGCEGTFDPRIQIYAQDCFNHDLCTRATGQIFGPCGDEWFAAFDDALLGEDCVAITGDWTVDLIGTGCFEGFCASIINYVAVYHFTQTGFSFMGVSDPAFDGRFSVYTGTVSNTLQTSGSWSIPTYLGSECGSAPLGVATGTFTGQNNCGEMTMDLEGSWDWYSFDTCTSIGTGSFEGIATATEGISIFESQSYVEENGPVEGGIAPSRPFPE